MTPFIPLANGAQAELLFELGSRIVENRLWFTFDNPPFGSTELAGLANGVRDWYISNILPSLSQDLLFIGVTATKWETPTDPAASSTGVAVSGGVASPTYSANVSIVVPFRWPRNLRGLKKNKNYVPGIPDSGVTVNTPSFPLQDALFEGYAALIDAARSFVPAFNWRWVVTSNSLDGEFRDEQLSADCIGPPRPIENRPDTHYKLGQRRRRLPH